jgi:hypothetical protein
MRTSSSALDARVLLAAGAWIARGASHDLSRCLRTGRLHELSAATRSPDAGWPDRRAMHGAGKRPHTMNGERWRRSDACSSGRVQSAEREHFRLVDEIGRRGRPPIGRPLNCLTGVISFRGRRLGLALVLRASVPADRAAEALATIDYCSTALRSVRTDPTDRDKLRSCATGSRFRIAGTAVTTPSKSPSDSIPARSVTCGHDRA